MFTAVQLDAAASSGIDGWVGPASITAGLVLLIVALFRRSRATLAKKRRAARPSAAD
ncbi:hypothetical protein [Saccharopolyspora mangrovi]|uniref:LPXTG cell wall anchor domain-containing protein n=1 Tax=Saccharopolyspora mangrovi TaxID=3082379 RepID=A0ABU6AH17_9PSEU|nr:hypothetical protein [Saccharopolyspora sp. S2-29]MEB3370805.1 hypothetical protein [Saccharopolyspora sp. S2-29]